MILHWKLTTYTVYFSFFALCGLSGCSGFHTSLPFCTTMWAHECASFHRDLFIDGFSLGKLFQVLISFSSFLSYCIEFLSFQPMVFSQKKKKNKRKPDLLSFLSSCTKIIMHYTECKNLNFKHKVHT